MSSDSESEWSDVDEDEDKVVESELPVSCLFCLDHHADIPKSFLHMKNDHSIDIPSYIQKSKLDFYGYVKFINFVRKEKPEALSLTAGKIISKSYLDDDCYLQPILENDMLLQFDVDSLQENNLTTGDFDVHPTLEMFKQRALHAEEALERTLLDLEKCRQELKKQFLGAAEEKVSHYNETNEGYFTSYAHHGIHEEMLKDQIRTQSYRDFILKNPKIFRDAIVLDVGCGTSILSMFSAKAGARKVFGVDNSDVAYQAIDVVKENKLENVVKIMKGKAEDLNMSEKVDVIISEWMGYFLLFESMLDTVLYCRDNYLSSNGRIYPDKCYMNLVAFSDDELYHSKVRFWHDVYGFKMSTMRNSTIEEPLIEVVNKDKIISKPAIIQELDLMKITIEELDFDAQFTLEITTDGVVNSIVGYFDIMFGDEKDENPVMFSTSPDADPTHWKQTVFFLKETVSCNAGDKLKGRIFCKKNKKDIRGLDVALIFFKGDSNDILMRQHYVIA